MDPQKCNILYITTLCNLDCDYCYERKDRETPGFKHKTVTKEEIFDFLNEIKAREGDSINHQVSIFGGEAFLRYDLIKYAFEKMVEIIPNTGVDIITNGTTFSDIEVLRDFKNLIDWCKERQVFITLEFSFDGAGHDRRVYANGTGSSKEVVIKSMDNAKELGLQFFISYTAHRDNCQKENIIKDAMKIMNRYQGFLTDFSLSFYQQEIKETLNLDEKGYAEYKQWIRERAIVLFEKYGIPTCDLICDICQKCEKGNFTGNNYFIPEYGNEFRDELTLIDHNHFTIEKEINGNN